VPFVQCFVPNVSDVSGLSILDCLFDYLKRLFMKFLVRGYHENGLSEMSVDITIFNSKCYIHMCVYMVSCLPLFLHFVYYFCDCSDNVTFVSPLFSTTKIKLVVLFTIVYCLILTYIIFVLTSLFNTKIIPVFKCLYKSA
jgi:hypothetical protein